MNTHFPEGIAAVAFVVALAVVLAVALAAGFAAALTADFGARLAELFFSVLRAAAGGAALARAVVDTFDFAAVFFFVFVTALAMTCK
ncbi:hypothetical protein [Bradyrhizobium sp.]|uniref:hypothetical protein n=1 Tax=Bradyrhizobium sp. TaxID=376 RepID=UPI002613503D|nr:hypothetical protein [Bradyrhizobium sp.]